MTDKIECKGFRAAGIACGLKKNGEKDLGLIFADTEATVAGVFTRNLVQAAPVVLNRERIKAGTCRALIVNSGNANCCTGKTGMEDALTMAKAAADNLGIPEETVLVASTGVIGIRLPVARIETATPALRDALDPEGFQDLARAIMTTDLVPKVVFRDGEIDGLPFRILGVAKGSGMIRPDMATMLCFVCTDAEVPGYVLQACLNEANSRSFNVITVDGDTSTNDTVLLMASGSGDVRIDGSHDRKPFQDLLNEVLLDLAKAIVRDGEGATKLIEIQVKGAATDIDAKKVADAIANSNLVKTAFFGEDANWGRIFGAAGRAGVVLDPESLDLFFDDVQMARAGQGCGEEAEARATEVLRKKEFRVTLDLNGGNGAATVWTCDFSLDYVRINADYRS